MNHDLFSSPQVAEGVESVTSLTEKIQQLMEERFFYLLVEGEISNLARPASGHLYFLLKDRNATIRAVIWRSTAATLSAPLKEGDTIRVVAKLSVYAPRGDYQLIVQRVEIGGVGNLYAEYLALKERLTKEGLFDRERKVIPKHPKKIGIITSPTAAALQDVKRVLTHHRPDIPYQLFPALVQGREAPSSLIDALEQANQDGEIDLILLVRGGGSIEDLWAFNDEQLARKISDSSKPIITGVGHETDYTIADFVADLRAATPSVAARMAAESAEVLKQRLDSYTTLFTRAVEKRLEFLKGALLRREESLQYLSPSRVLKREQEMLKQLEARLLYHSPQERVEELQERLDGRREALREALEHRVNTLKQMLAIQSAKLSALSPFSTLARGYAIVEREGEVIEAFEKINIGDSLSLQLEGGRIEVEVKAKSVQ